MLECRDGSFYVGSTRNLEQRVAEHAAGGVEAYTRERRPITLVWAQECEHINDAYLLEHKIKGWRRAKKIALIEGRFVDLPGLSTSGRHTTPEGR